MLMDLRNRLRKKATDPLDDYALNIRRLTGPNEASLYEEPLRQMILALPDMVAQIRRWVDEWPYIPSIDRTMRLVLFYLHNPLDLFPDYSMGLFGYLDDAYVAAAAYDRLLSGSPESGLRMRPADEMLARSVSKWLRLSRSLLPAETAYLENLLDKADGRPFNRADFHALSAVGRGKD